VDDIRIADLTVGQLESLIKVTVQEAMAEVLMEFSIAAELEAEVAYQAEVTDCIRTILHERPFQLPELEPAVEFDD
jgi:hypothetical protein